MRSISHKLGALALSLLLLFSTLSFTLDMHFCGETLVDFGLYHPAEDCGMSMDGQSMDASDCCSDVEVYVQGQDDLNPGLDVSPDLPRVVFQQVFETWVMALAEDLPRTFIPFKEYSPPRLVCDISIRDQSFLI